MDLPEEGEEAPGFTLPSQSGEEVSLDDFRGRKVVLYFYPKDFTSGCTKEACSFRDRFDEFKDKDAVILGVSNDSVDSHKKFAEKHDLPFQLLSDEDKDVTKTYGVYGTKKSFGREYEGITRTTFLIDEDGVIEKVFPRVRVDGHDEEVLATLDGE